MKRSTLIVTLLLACPGLAMRAAEKPSASPVPLFLTTPAATGGFTDPDKERADTMKDLTEALRGEKNIRRVATREEANAVIEVLDRKVREDSGKLTQMMGGKHEVKRINLKLSVGEYSTDLQAESAGGGFSMSGSWKQAAGKAAGLVEKWVEESRAQIEKVASAPAQPAEAPKQKQPHNESRILSSRCHQRGTSAIVSSEASHPSGSAVDVGSLASCYPVQDQPRQVACRVRRQVHVSLCEERQVVDE